MDIYVAVKRVRFDIDEVIGVFSDREKAEESIVKHILDVKTNRASTTEETIFMLAASWEVDVWTVDTNTKKENWALTESLLFDEVTKMESA